jgi:SAM-dependent methyltransferase
MDDVRGWYAATTLALGERTGLLDALLSGGGTAAGLAARAGVDRRIATAWAGAMVAAGYAHSVDGSYTPDEEAVGPLRGGFPFDMRAVVEFLAAAGALFPRVETAFRDGAGIGSDELQAALGDLPTRISTPMYRMFLVDDWIAGHPEVKAALRAGVDVAEIGPGEGASLRHLGVAFPTSRFVGYDVDPRLVARGNAVAQRDGLANVRLEVAVGRLPAASFDVVGIFDALHHFTRPGDVLDDVRSALRDGGCLLLAEPALTGDPNVDAAADPSAIITYGCDLLYCLQEGLADGGAGLGATCGSAALRQLLADHGYVVEGAHVSSVGYEVMRAVPSR